MTYPEQMQATANMLMAHKADYKTLQHCRCGWTTRTTMPVDDFDYLYAEHLATQVAGLAGLTKADLYHAGGNAEDCPICRHLDLEYPWLCAGDQVL